MTLALVTLVLSVLSLVLHFIAPRTKTTLDDKGAELADKGLDYLKSQDKESK